jgi:hypothetical protein
MNKPLVGVLTAIAIFAGAQSSQATMPMQKKAKELGFAESTKCLYCHGEKMPKKDSSTYNERGNFLIKMKEEKKAKEVDVAWLKEYVEPKK